MNRAKLPDRPSPQSPSDAQAREKLAIFVYEYLTHMGAKNAAKNFLDEIGWNKDVKISDGPGFLQTWWCVFWDLYCAAPDRRATHEHSQEAKAFHDFGMLPGLMNGLHVPNPVGSPMGGSDAGAGPSTSAAGLRQQQSPLAQPHVGSPVGRYPAVRPGAVGPRGARELPPPMAGGVMPGMYMSRLPSAGAPNGGRLPPPGHIAPPGYAAMRPGSVQRPPWMPLVVDGAGFPPSTSMGPPGGGVPTSMALNGADGGMAPVSANGPLADPSQPHQAHNGHAYPMPMYGVGVMPVDGGPAPSNPDNAESIGSGTAPPNNKRRRQSSGVADRPGSADTKSLSGGGAMGGPLAAGDMKGSPAPPACVGKNHSGGPGSVPAPASLTPGAGMSANPPSVSKTSSGRQMSGGNNKQNSDSIDFNSAAPYPQGENEQSEIAKIKASIMDDSKQFEGKDPNGESEFF